MCIRDRLSGLVGLLLVENQEADDLLLTSRGGDDEVDDEGVDNVVDAINSNK